MHSPSEYLGSSPTLAPGSVFPPMQTQEAVAIVQVNSVPVKHMGNLQSMPSPDPGPCPAQDPVGIWGSDQQMRAHDLSFK